MTRHADELVHHLCQADHNFIAAIEDNCERAQAIALVEELGAHLVFTLLPARPRQSIVVRIRSVEAYLTRWTWFN